MRVKTGLERWISDGFSAIKGQRIGLLCNQASVASDFVHALDHLLKAGTDVVRVFGPQHGIWGHTQDNMIEWEGYKDPRTGLNFVSLYGEHREPTDEMLRGLDRLVIDLQDVGARYYTFIWTMALCMKACARTGVPVTVLDRPNPINGSDVEGPGVEDGFTSFVGLHSLPIRHGLTIGEIAADLRDRFYPVCELEVVKMTGWTRGMFFVGTSLPWVPPSPNMPTPETALVYPGQCLLEGTNLSEGRGTTRPFETFGAPWIDAWRLLESLASLRLPGVHFRPIQFQPTFQKYAGEVCQGAFLHVTDRMAFRPVATIAALLWVVRSLFGDVFQWRRPPYEYEETHMPIDVLTGSSTFRHLIDEGKGLDELLGWAEDVPGVTAQHFYR